MAKKRPWSGEHWRDLAQVTIVRADGSVDWKFPWSTAEKREYLEQKREQAKAIADDPADFDPNGGMLGMLEDDIQRTEAEEAEERRA